MSTTPPTATAPATAAATKATGKEIERDIAKLDATIPIILEVYDISKKEYKKTGEIYYKTTFKSSDRKTTLIKELDNLMQIGDRVVIIPQSINRKSP